MFSGLIKPLRISISARLAIFFSLTFSVFVIGAFSFAYFEVYYSLEKASEDVISAKWREMAAVVGRSDVKELHSFLASDGNRLRNAHFMVRVLTGQGRTIFLKPSAQSETFEFEKMYEQFTNPAEMTGWHALQAVNDEDKFDILTGEVSPGIYLQVGKSSEDREHVIEKLGASLGVGALVLILFSGILGAWYARRSLAPIRELAKAIHSIEGGNLGQRVPVTGAEDELRELSLIFNRMVGRIERLILAMRESLDNVAHDIRTPLTRIRNVAEVALVKRDPLEAFVALEECAENVSEVSALLDQLMDISDANAGTLKLKVEELNVANLADELFDLYQFVAEEKSIEMVFEGSRELSWALDRRRFKQALANLLDNALKYSPKNSVVRIKARSNSSGLEIDVEDQGFGIPNEDQPRIWDRLFRSDRSRSTKGMGIGLSIVRSIAQAHGGKAILLHSSPEGSAFRLSVPSPR